MTAVYGGAVAASLEEQRQEQQKHQPEPVQTTSIESKAHSVNAAADTDTAAIASTLPPSTTATSVQPPPTDPSPFYLLHIRPLSRSVTAAHLRDIFSHFGDVSVVAVPLDATVQLPLGYGVVGMEREDDAERAVECMNGGWIDGQQVTCRRKGAKTAASQQKQQQQQTSEPTTPHSHSHHFIDHSPHSPRTTTPHYVTRHSNSTALRDDRRRSRSPTRRRSWADDSEREMGGSKGRSEGRHRSRRSSATYDRSGRSRSRSSVGRRSDSRDRSRSRSRSNSRTRDRERRRRHRR